MSVNGENVVGLTVADIRERIVGPIGSQVSVTLESATTGEVFERVLVRGNAQPVERVERLPAQMAMRVSMDAPNILSRSMDARHMQPLPPQALSNDLEMQRQARRIMELESQLNITREEYQRTKALLDTDRNSSERTVKEIDFIQRKNSQHIMELQNLLNKSEQARRELELQVLTSYAHVQIYRRVDTYVCVHTCIHAYVYARQNSHTGCCVCMHTPLDCILCKICLAFMRVFKRARFFGRRAFFLVLVLVRVGQKRMR